MNSVFISFSFAGVYPIKSDLQFPDVESGIDNIVVDYDISMVNSEEDFFDFQEYVADSFKDQIGFDSVTLKVIYWKVLS